MSNCLHFHPSTLIAIASPDRKKPLELTLTNVLANRPLIFRACIEKQPSCFQISLPNGYGTALHAVTSRDKRDKVVNTFRPETLLVERIGDEEPLDPSRDTNALVIHWCAILPTEVDSFAGSKQESMWKKAWDRVKSHPSLSRGTFRVPIEIFNPNISVNPIETWKDNRRWTNFTYRPGVEDKAAVFKPQSFKHYTDGFFTRLWDCKVVIGERSDEGVAKRVVVKEMRIFGRNSGITLDMERIRKRAKRNFQIWMKLDHENVDSIVGEILHPEVCIMTPRYECGDVLDYIRAQQRSPSSWKAKREIRVRLIKEVTSGLEYLHSQEVVHGDLHHVHVFIDQDGRAKIANYGLAVILAKEQLDRPWIGSPARYLTPEYVLANAPPTKQSDIYRYGLLILEATGDTAFSGLFPGPIEVARNMAEQTHLPEPAEFKRTLKETGPFWNIFHQCCAYFPKERPSMQTISQQIHAISFPGDIYQEPRKGEVLKDNALSEKAEEGIQDEGPNAQEKPIGEAYKDEAGTEKEAS